MKKFKRIKPFLAVISLFLLINLFQETYAKYTTGASGHARLGIARWLIKINNQDIIESNYITNVINPTIITSPHVKDNVLAPRSTGYFDLVIDYNDVDVSFDYIVNVDVSNQSSVSDLKVTGYSEDGGSVISTPGTISNLTETVLLGDTPRTKTLRVYLMWEDSETEHMNNEADTNAALSQEPAILNVTLRFTQKTI
ncbi:MAG: hypothetical protein GX864_04400 [Mollicutes bacterium]|jgi:hypothetical protein|nr:hypothetical protein [Mollicutes bacterium]